MSAERAEPDALCPRGPGRLVLVVGPSAAGKDTLLRHASAALRHESSIVFSRRIVTRPSSAAEEHDSMLPDEFLAAARAGAFALTWSAHGLRYGVPVAIDADVAAGRNVVCNVSRSIVAQARERYLNVTVVLITAPADILRARLLARGRASDVDLAQRLARASGFDDLQPNCVITNAAAVETAAAALIGVLRDALTPLASDQQGADPQPAADWIASTRFRG